MSGVDLSQVVARVMTSLRRTVGHVGEAMAGGIQKIRHEAVETGGPDSRLIVEDEQQVSGGGSGPSLSHHGEPGSENVGEQGTVANGRDASADEPNADQVQVQGSMNVRKLQEFEQAPRRLGSTGLVTGVDPKRSAPTPALDGNELGATLRLRAVEARGVDHVELAQKANIGRDSSDPMVTIQSGNLTVNCNIRYRVPQMGPVQVTTIYDHADTSHPNFETVQRLIDASFMKQFPGRDLDIWDFFDHDGGTTVGRWLIPGSTGTTDRLPR